MRGPRRAVAVALTAVIAIVGIQPSVAAADGWQRYVLGPSSADVNPVRVVSSSGQVTNPQGLVDSGTGPTTLTMTSGGPAPVLLLDYGKDVGGLPYFAVTAVAGTPTLQAGYSEAQQFAGPTGDAAVTTFHPHAGMDQKRVDQYPVTAPGVIDAQLVQGGERFEYLTLTQPGSVTLSSVGVHFTAVRATPDDYQGWFSSSDDQLNRIWFAGAYTTQLDMAPAGSVDGGGQPVVFDGAKRDRLVWSGDLVRMVPVVADSLGDGGADYLRQSIAILAAGQDPVTGAIPGFAEPAGKTVYYSASYSTLFVHGLAAYYRYTGDETFTRQQYSAMRRELDYDQSLVNPTTGLLVTDSSNGMAWDYYDGPRIGAVTEYNVLYYRALTEAAYIADGLGNSVDAQTYRQRAGELRAAINSTLFNPATGVYDISDTKRGAFAEDANSAAVAYGVAPAERVAGILDTLRQKLWIPRGSLPFSADAGYVNWVSPYLGGLELQARFDAGDTANAFTLLRNEWGEMVAPGPQYTGGLWESVNPDGTLPKGEISLAHGWSAGPTSTLTGYVLGTQPVAPGYRTWLVAPHPGDLLWARGQTPTTAGPLAVNWSSGSGFSLSVSAPAGTSGTVSVPLLGGSRVISEDGHVVWDGSRAVGTATATSDGTYVSFTGITCRHVWSW